jgi:hypothetical protein
MTAGPSTLHAEHPCPASHLSLLPATSHASQCRAGPVPLATCYVTLHSRQHGSILARQSHPPVKCRAQLMCGLGRRQAAPKLREPLPTSCHFRACCWGCFKHTGRNCCRSMGWPIPVAVPETSAATPSGRLSGLSLQALTTGASSSSFALPCQPASTLCAAEGGLQEEGRSKKRLRKRQPRVRLWRASLRCTQSSCLFTCLANLLWMQKVGCSLPCLVLEARLQLLATWPPWPVLLPPPFPCCLSCSISLPWDASSVGLGAGFAAA